MRRITLDTNVYVSALEFGGIGSRLLGMAKAGEVRLDLSQPILDELVTVLRDDFHWEAYRLHFAMQELARIGNVVSPRITLSVSTDPDDNRIIECAVEAGSDFIISDDKHLLKIGSFQGIAILRPVNFLQSGI